MYSIESRSKWNTVIVIVVFKYARAIIDLITDCMLIHSGKKMSAESENLM